MVNVMWWLKGLVREGDEDVVVEAGHGHLCKLSYKYTEVIGENLSFMAFFFF